MLPLGAEESASVDNQSSIVQGTGWTGLGRLNILMVARTRAHASLPNVPVVPRIWPGTLLERIGVGQRSPTRVGRVPTLDRLKNLDVALWERVVVNSHGL